ncbi:hypothetical protein ACLBWX_22520 [Methylobacterium sp. M6A4_1b]
MQIVARLFLLIGLLVGSPSLALDRTLLGQTFGPLSADTLTLRKPGSSGDASGLSATLPNGMTGYLRDLFGAYTSAGPYLVGKVGTAQITAGLQAAITAVANQGLALKIPAGDYVVSGLTFDATRGGSIIGDPSSVRLKASGNNVRLITVVNSTAGYNPVTIEGLGLYGNGFGGVVGIRCDNPQFLNLRNLHTHFIDYAARISSSSAGGAFKVTIANVMQWGQGSWVFEGTAFDRLLFDVNISNVNHFSNGTSAWAASWFTFRNVISLNLNNILSNSLDGATDAFNLLEHIEGVFANNVIVGFPKSGFKTRANGYGTPPAYIYLSNFAIDQPKEIGLDLEAYVIKVTNGNVTGSRYRNGTGACAVIRSTTVDYAFTNFFINDCNHSGFVVEAGARNGSVMQSNFRGNAFVDGYDLDVAARSPLDPVFGPGNFFGTVNATGQIIVGGRSSRYWAVDRAQVGTPASTATTTLKQYTVPAGGIPYGETVAEPLLPTNGTLRVRASGSFGANANTKAVVASVGGTDVISANGAYNGQAWAIEMDIEPVGTSAWVTARVIVGGAVVASANPLLAKDFTAAQLIRIYGANGAAVANDITAGAFSVEAVL